jgi:hypothetical protein
MLRIFYKIKVKKDDQLEVGNEKIPTSFFSFLLSIGIGSVEL